MSEQITQSIRTVRFMDERGHSSFGWDPEDDEWVRPMIEKKMAEGYTFWIIARNPTREVQLTRMADIGDVRHVIIRDREARELFEQGRIGIAAEPDERREPMQPSRRARTADEAVAADTVAHRPLRGG